MVIGEFIKWYVNSRHSYEVNPDLIFLMSQNLEFHKLIENMKQPNLQLAQQLLADWWLNNTEVTSLQFKEELRSEYPDYIWNQQWVSHFLSQTDHEWADMGQYKLYFRDQSIKTSQPAQVGTMLSVIPVSQGELYAAWLNHQSNNPNVIKTVTKQNIKNFLITGGIDLSNFDEEFENSNFQFTGKYTSDNKKYYVWVKDDEYWSQSKQEILKLGSLAKPHIKNSLLRRYFNIDVEYILANPNDEVTKLLKQYFK